MSESISDRCSAAVSVSRRTFLGSALVLGASAPLVTLTGCSQSATPVSGFSYLRAFDLEMLRKIAPSIIGISEAQLDDATWQQFSQQLDRSLVILGEPIAAEYLELFDLLHWLPTRGILAGQWRGWSQADTATVESFLNRWHTSSFETLNKGYRALTVWQQSAWYALPAGANQTGYTGAPNVIVKALGLS